MSNETIIFSMAGVSKVYPPQKQVLKNIYLSYFYGAKIGVLGLNGSGKSTLLRILAQKDRNFQGQLSCAPGLSIGLLEQEPQLEQDRTVRQVVEQGVAAKAKLVNDFNANSDVLGEPDLESDEMEKLLEEQGAHQEKIEQQTLWGLDSQRHMAIDAVRCPPQEAKVGALSGGEKRCVALCRLLLQMPDVLL